MAEPLFGTISPVWSAMPFPGLAWFQSPMAGNRGIGSAQGSSPITSMMAGASPGFGAASSSAAPAPMAAPWAPLFNPELSGITAPALVMAVAVRRGQPAGPTSDQEIEDFIYDALDLLPATNDVEIRCDGGRATLAGTVSQKRLKRDIGEIAWAIPAINDVHNTITIAPRRRARASSREAEPPAAAGRKPA
jgi:BON domain